MPLWGLSHRDTYPATLSLGCPIRPKDVSPSFGSFKFLALLSGLLTLSGGGLLLLLSGSGTLGGGLGLGRSPEGLKRQVSYMH